MEEIKVEEYVRTKNGIVDKVVEIINAGSGLRFLGEYLDNTIIVTEGDILSRRRFNLEHIVKHSKNIKDLVQAGDVIRYKLKNLKHENLIEVKEYKDMKTGEKYLGVEGFYLEQIEILEILTKEQFARESYKVVEE